tara:strand:- start:423 stop:818 length:396 start_codon:yes stop_codon:yes gene_type:complete
MNTFQLDIITPISLQSFDSVSYLRIPSLDGLTGIQAKHANSIIALGIGEIKITINGSEKYFSTSGGFIDIKPESVQLLLETIEETTVIDKKRAEDSLERATQRLDDKSNNIERAQRSIQRAKNRLDILNKI